MEQVSISKHELEKIISTWAGKPAALIHSQPLKGGMLNYVLALSFDIEPYQAVIKLSPEENAFQHEYESLLYLRNIPHVGTHRNLFPKPFMQDSSGSLIGRTFLLMERIPGTHFGLARLSKTEKITIEQELALYLSQVLHKQKGEYFGPLFAEKPYKTWTDYFYSVLWELRSKTKEQFKDHDLYIVDQVIQAVPEVLRTGNLPTLVHGDIWAANIMIGTSNDNKPYLAGLIDPGALYADKEYELAYLECFQTVGDSFFTSYTQHNSIRDGYAVRRLFYWLHTMLVHIWYFGDSHYYNRCIEIAKSILKNI